MNINAIQPDGPTIAIEGQPYGEQPVNVTPEGTQPAYLGPSMQPLRTNGDLLRSLRNEELAKWLAVIERLARAKGVTTIAPEKLTEFWLDWLESPAEVGTWAN